MCEVHKPEKTVELLEAFFFEAMLQGYAASTPKVPVVDLPGSKSIRYVRGNLLLVDFWFASPVSKSSHGMTVISCEGRPVWAMHYGGWYEEHAIPHLKAALREAYSKNRFMGGRGPYVQVSGDPAYAYYNDVDPNQDTFAMFRGLERILHAASGQTFGEHHYFGGLMI